MEDASRCRSRARAYFSNPTGALIEGSTTASVVEAEQARTTWKPWCSWCRRRWVNRPGPPRQVARAGW